MSEFKPTLDELKSRASLFWPKELLDKAEALSVIPWLIATQDKFISILDVSERSPDSWKDVLRVTKDLSANLFLKHLMVLADVGGEPLKRLRTELPRLFPEGHMLFVWNNKKYEYKFQKILKSGRLDNASLAVDGISLTSSRLLDSITEDVIMLLLFGSAITNASLPNVIADKCTIGTLIGKSAELRKFVKERYIFVSRITAGATSNTLGQVAQDAVRDVLQEALPAWRVKRNGQIPGISQNAGETDMNFDVVAISPSKKSFAIEVSYQVTTNSVVERKAGQAQARQHVLHQAGHQIAYVIDGAGNFERQAALRTICQFSDCTVAFNPKELKTLVGFLKQNA
jgi:hypothetical protein